MVRTARVAPTLALVSALAALAACSKSEPVGTTSTTSAELDDPKAHDQSSSADDLAVVRDVRQRLVADPVLGAGAKNAVIVVQGGTVTLRGTVADSIEHDLVVQKVASVPGVGQIDDRLVIAH